MGLTKLFNKFGSNAVLRLISDLLVTLGSQNAILYLCQVRKFETIPIGHTPANLAFFCYHYLRVTMNWKDVHLALLK